METVASPNESRAPEIVYASFTARVSALVTDFAVVGAGLVFIVLGGSALQGIPGSGPIQVALLWALTILYEPLLVWRRGATIGHRRCNLRVVTASGDRPGFLRSLSRFAIKSVLGVVSFIPMFLTQRHQALQDLATDTRVIVDNPDAVPSYYGTAERTADWMTGAPPAGRRIVVTIFYLFAISVAVLVTLGSVSADCVSAHQCTLADTAFLQGGIWGWLAVSCGIVIAGWRGILPGARRRPTVETNLPVP